MSNNLKASGIESVVCKNLGNYVASLVLRDVRHKSHAFLINPETLCAILQPALGLAAMWSDSQDLEVGTWSGPQNALAANYLSLERGRTAEECAVRVVLGPKLEMTFLIPLDYVIAACAALTRVIDPISGQKAH